MFVDLTASYDTVWHHSLTCKLLQLLPDRHMVCMIVDMVSTCSFTLTTRNGKQNRLRCFKNGVPKESILAPLPFNIYISDVPTTVSRKYAYADMCKEICFLSQNGFSSSSLISYMRVNIGHYLLINTKQIYETAESHVWNWVFANHVKQSHIDSTLTKLTARMIIASLPFIAEDGVLVTRASR